MFGTSIYDKYQGITCNIREVQSIDSGWVLGNNSFLRTFSPSLVFMPSELYNYRSDIVTNYLTNSSSDETSAIISAINEQTQATETQTQAIETQTQVEQQTQDFITNDTISTEDGEMDIDTSGMSVSDSNGVNDFFTNFYESLLAFFNNISSDVVIVHIPVPFTSNTIDLRSDIISSHISGTFIATLISTMWYFVFGTYFLFYIRFLIRFFSTGEFGTSGLAYFIEHLEDNDVIIRSTMM